MYRDHEESECIKCIKQAIHILYHQYKKYDNETNNKIMILYYTNMIIYADNFTKLNNEFLINVLYISFCFIFKQIQSYIIIS